VTENVWGFFQSHISYVHPACGPPVAITSHASFYAMQTCGISRDTRVKCKPPRTVMAGLIRILQVGNTSQGAFNLAVACVVTACTMLMFTQTTAVTGLARQ